MKGRIEQIAYIGWLGIDYEAITLDKGAFTGLIGPSGAGKSTLTMCLAYAQLPDRRVLDISPISDLQDPHNAGKDSLLGRISPNYGYAYVMLDILTRHGKRLIAGIHAQGEDGRGNLTRFYIDNYPEGAPLQDAFRVSEGDTQHYPDLPDLKRSLAARGYDLHICRQVQDYGQVLYEAGVLPTNLADFSDRSLYSKLIEATYRGGISADVASKLKDYLLPEDRKVPEMVSKIQGCTSQVFSTRRTLGDADRQLNLLQATYGTGKEIVLHALRHEIDMQSIVELEIERLEREVTADRETLSNKTQEIQLLAGDIQTTEETIKTLQQSTQTELRTEEGLMDVRGTAVQTKKTAHDAAKGQLNQFKKGEKAWKAAAGIHADRDPTWLSDWLDKEIENRGNDIARKGLEIEGLQANRAALVVGTVNTKTATLAKSVGGQTLEEVFDESGDQQAIALEMGLCGLVDGVVGVTPDVLVNLESSQELPDIFWLGERPPGEAPVRTVGQWNVSAGAGGYIVSSKRRHPVFGRQARENRISDIDRNIKALLEKQKTHRIEKEGEDGKGGLKGRLSSLQMNHEAIAFYIENRGNAIAIEQNAETAKKAYDDAVRLHGESQFKVEDLRNKLLKVAEPHQEKLKELNTKKSNAERILDEISKRLPGKQDSLKENQGHLQKQRDSMALMIETLGQQGEPFLSDARGMESTLPDIYNVEQTRRIINLRTSLEGEPPARLELIQAASPTDTSSCIRLWPMLLEILRDRIVLDLADMDGADLLSEMRKRRNNLNDQLGLQENEVRIQARSLHSAIQSSVSSQRNRIRALSKLGEDIHFGNIVGIRIVVDTRQEMLSMLEGFADQMSLFQDNTKPVDQSLREFFAAASEKYKFTGEELLDYRNYMDLRIEARRKNKEWETASSLSGGESIGGGLAIALMLSRSMASRGEIKPEHITPLFVIDELHRLDPKGQGMIVDFAKREGFQVYVTAQALKPNFECTLYTLERIYDPEERLIIRGQEKKLSHAA